MNTSILSTLIEFVQVPGLMRTMGLLFGAAVIIGFLLRDQFNGSSRWLAWMLTGSIFIVIEEYMRIQVLIYIGTGPSQRAIMLAAITSVIFGLSVGLGAWLSARAQKIKKKTDAAETDVINQIMENNHVS